VGLEVDDFVIDISKICKTQIPIYENVFSDGIVWLS
jgi:hypothetical protein